MVVAPIECLLRPGNQVPLDQVVRRERHVEVGFDDHGRSAKAAWRHADDGVAPSVENRRAAEKVFGEAGSRPLRVARDGHRGWRSRPLLFGSEGPSARQRHAERVEVVRRHDIDHRPAGRLALGDAGHRQVVCREMGEGPARGAQVLEIRIGEGTRAARRRPLQAVQADNRAGCARGQARPQQQAVDQREDAGIDADAECQHQDRGRGEPAMARRAREN